MSQQSTTGFGVANPVPYSPEKSEEVQDLAPSDSQPPGVDDDEPQSLEEALTG